MPRPPAEGSRTGAQVCAVLYPAIAEAAHRAGADAVGLVGVAGPAGLSLHVDRVGITYSNGQSLGDPAAPVQVSAAVRGHRPIPERAMPAVVARVGVGRDPLETAGAERGPRAVPPLLLMHGDAVELLPAALARVPADALPVVTTTWALSRLPLASRLRFLHRLDEAAAGRPVAWVSAEGVGVAPAIPTMGDRHASGHSIIGLAVFGPSTLRAEAMGRCWSRGRFLAWLAGS